MAPQMTMNPDYAADLEGARRLREKLDAMPADERKAYSIHLLKRAGILNRNGRLAKAYRND